MTLTFRSRRQAIEPAAVRATDRGKHCGKEGREPSLPGDYGDMTQLLERFPWLGVVLQRAVTAAIGVALHAVLHAVARRAALHFALADRLVGAVVRTESITP